MKLPIFILAFVLISASLLAQEKKMTRVHIRKVEVINGVEKITDTSYTSDQALPDLNITTEPVESLPGDNTPTQIKVIEIGDPEHPEATNTMSISILDKMTEEESKTFRDLKAKHIELATNPTKSTLPTGWTKSINIGENGDTTVLIKNDRDLNIDMTDGRMLVIKKAPCGSSQEVIMNAPVEAIVTVCRKVFIRDLDAADQLKLKANTNHLSGTELTTDELTFSPNPSDGKFKMHFLLPSKGDVQINIFDSEGRTVYNENIKNFSGSYFKDFDLSEQTKGTYFVKINQGSQVRMKKIVID